MLLGMELLGHKIYVSLIVLGTAKLLFKTSVPAPVYCAKVLNSHCSTLSPALGVVRLSFIAWYIGTQLVFFSLIPHIKVKFTCSKMHLFYVYSLIEFMVIV